MIQQRINRPAVVRHRGVALIVVMLIMIAITGISLWTARQSLLSEGIARNENDQVAAQQAAEAALRDAERDFLTALPTTAANASCSRGKVKLIPSDFTSDCKTGLCFQEDSEYPRAAWQASPAVAEFWWPAAKGGQWNDDPATKPGRVPSVTANRCSDFTGGVPLGTFTGVAPVSGVARQPEYLIEYFKRKNVRLNLAETQVSGQGNSPNEWSAMYRITARGFGYSERTQVVLQSIFIP